MGHRARMRQVYDHRLYTSISGGRENTIAEPSPEVSAQRTFFISRTSARKTNLAQAQALHLIRHSLQGVQEGNMNRCFDLAGGGVYPEPAKRHTASAGILKISRGAGQFASEHRPLALRNQKRDVSRVEGLEENLRRMPASQPAGERALDSLQVRRRFQPACGANEANCLHVRLSSSSDYLRKCSRKFL